MDGGQQAALMATGVLGPCSEAAGLSQEESPGALSCSSGAVRAPPGFMGPFPLQGKSSRKTSSYGQRGWKDCEERGVMRV